MNKYGRKICLESFYSILIHLVASIMYNYGLKACFESSYFSTFIYLIASIMDKSSNNNNMHLMWFHKI